ERKGAYERAVEHNLLAQGEVALGVNAVDARAEHRQGDSLCRERAAVRGRVDAFGEAARDHEPARRKRSAELVCRVPAAGRGAATADHGERRIFERVEAPGDVKG